MKKEEKNTNNRSLIDDGPQGTCTKRLLPLRKDIKSVRVYFLALLVIFSTWDR